MKKDPDIKLGIVGAGIAGLTAAEVLKEKGFRNITVFERESFAGGKCRSIEYKGRMYELGAGVIAETDRTIQKLIKKFDLSITPINDPGVMYIDEKTGQSVVDESTLAEKASLFQELAFKYRKLCNKYQEDVDPGLSGIDEDLLMPFSPWAKKHGVEHLVKELAPFFVGFGYGYFEEVPAIYVLKHYSWGTIKSFLKKKMYKLPGGIQSICTAIAKDHNVVYSTTIESIHRGEKIQVKTAERTFEFDELILTSPLDEALEYLDATNEEASMFSKIEYVDYRTYTCKLRKFPKKEGFLPKNFHHSAQNHPVFWYHRYEDSDFYAFYVMADWKATDEEVMKNIEGVVHQLGGEVVKNHSATHWKYFPHVSIAEMKAGYFDKLEMMQGKNNTYYAGELLNFSTVELSAVYAQALVNRFF